MARVCFMAAAVHSSLYQCCVKTSPGAHPATYPVGTEDSFARGRATEA